jgi:drug/metabolite transporter (DMT)-like permease
VSHASNRRGILAMLIAAAVFSLMDTGLKLLSPHYPAVEVAALRCLASLPLILVYVGWRNRFRGVLKIRWGLQVLRAILGVGILSAFTLGVRRLPLAEAYSIFFIAPALIAALSAVVLKERVDAPRWIAIATGMVGVLVVLRPTGESMLTLSGLAVLAAAGAYALGAILVRILGRTDSSESLILWSSAMMSVFGLVFALPSWQPVRLEHAGELALIGLSGFFGQIAIIEAFRQSEASAVAPFEYTALAWGVTIDWLLWHVLPDRYTLLGAAIIIGSGIYLARRETVHMEAEHP